MKWSTDKAKPVCSTVEATTAQFIYLRQCVSWGVHTCVYVCVKHNKRNFA